MAVYFIQNVETGRIKIGHTYRNGEARVNDMKTGNGCELVILDELPDAGLAAEHWFHRHFDNERARGEWFDGAIIEDLRQTIADVRSGTVELPRDPKPGKPVGRPNLGGRKRTVTTDAAIELTLAEFMVDYDGSEASALRDLIALGIAQWTLEQIRRRKGGN